ncbi:DUF2249 domain-containing protein [Alicyclobacillus tolerans]|uniref:DUF2249 domain-containing protein n=1 Tax=Alicyclobacillus tolerans TaxID=90970 RepID=UPI001F3749D5|nr:DUF2249 domain-containing protein [Alicyclobacillus tolerans]MCF8566382.1 DUF2249 domain-containing protein [Alicyclobacillus tolerans]
MEKNLVELDVRPILKAKQEPFQVIMEAVGKLNDDDVLELHATFDPAPLKKVLGKQGFQSVVKKQADDHYIIQFYKNGGDLSFFHIDNRGLEPPEPMVRTLDLLDTEAEYGTGALGLEIWNERVPAFLLPELEERGFAYDINDLGNGTVVIQIHK